MAEYIEREKVKDELLSWAVCINHPEHLLKEDALCVIDSIPAADVEPVKHGRWVDRYGGKYANPLYECSECKEAALKKDELNALGSWRTVQVLSAHCPHCGAKMDLEDSDG